MHVFYEDRKTGHTYLPQVNRCTRPLGSSSLYAKAVPKPVVRDFMRSGPNSAGDLGTEFSLKFHYFLLIIRKMKFYAFFNIFNSGIKYSDKKHSKVNNELMDFTLDQKESLRCSPYRTLGNFVRRFLENKWFNSDLF